MTNPLHGLDVSRAFWALVKERRLQMNTRRPRGTHYCIWCDREMRVGFAHSKAHENSKQHIANVLRHVAANA